MLYLRDHVINTKFYKFKLFLTDVTFKLFKLFLISWVIIFFVITKRFFILSCMSPLTPSVPHCVYDDVDKTIVKNQLIFFFSISIWKILVLLQLFAFSNQTSNQSYSFIPALYLILPTLSLSLTCTAIAIITVQLLLYASPLVPTMPCQGCHCSSFKFFVLYIFN